MSSSAPVGQSVSKRVLVTAKPAEAKLGGKHIDSSAAD